MKQMLALLYLTIFCLFSLAQAQTRYETKSFTVTIKGTSTMHDWESDVTQVSLSGEFTLDGTTLKSINTANLEMQTKSIKSKKQSSMMDNRTYSTLKADQNPKIKFALTKVNSLKANGAEYAISLNGNLTLAGSTLNTELTMKAKVLSNNILEFSGTKKLKMSDYGIKPPSFMMGALKVGDEVTITYTIQLKKSAQQFSSN
jgi:polyisoprenoid-binding protein YceI